MSASAILEYFKPLHDFLVKENIKLAKEDDVRQKLEQYDKKASALNHKIMLAAYDHATDSNNKTKESLHFQAIRENAKFRKEQYEIHFKAMKPNDFIDEKIQRQILYLTNLNTDILDDAKLKNLTEIKANMLNVYNNAKFCNYSKPNCEDDEKLTLDPGIIIILLIQILKKQMQPIIKN